MAILWLGFVSMFLVALAIPVVQHFMYSAGRVALIRQIVEGFVAFVLEVALFTAFVGIAGYLTAGVGGAMAFGLTGLTVSFIVVSILGAFRAANDWRFTLSNR
jgi:hypothetical protein